MPTKTLKTKVVLEDGEAYVVAPLDFWEHLVMVYKSLAEDQSNPQIWLEAADFISKWISATLYIAPSEEDEWH